MSKTAAAAGGGEGPRWQRGSTETKVVEGSNLDVNKLTQRDFDVERLSGPATYDNPMLHIVDPQFKEEMERKPKDHNDYIAFDPIMDISSGSGTGGSSQGKELGLRSKLAIQKAAIRGKLHFNPETTTVGIVTCGGLCPGLNDVVRAITHACIGNYGVRRVYGFRYGFWGLSKAGRHTALELSRSIVHDLHRHGGSFLGSSRGPQSKEEMIETLLQLKINVLFCVGGDGTQRGAMMIANEARRRGLDIAVMGIPKTIDNDLSFSHRTFGFETAVEEAVKAIRAANAEATSVQYGVGVVKVMGRHSGFIAAQATLASELVNLCFIPENPIDFDVVKQLIETRFMFSTHCVICVAEGFGQDWPLKSSSGSGSGSGDPEKKLGKDESGNQKLFDIGQFLSTQIASWLKTHPKFKTGTVKYIDPSYMVRGCPPNTSDAAFCVHLANLAVHEAMAGSTNAILTYWYSNYVVVPTRLATSLRRVVNTRGLLWKLVREMTVSVVPRQVLEKRQRHLAEIEIRAADKKTQQLKQLISKL